MLEKDQHYDVVPLGDVHAIMEAKKVENREGALHHQLIRSILRGVQEGFFP